MNNFLVISSQNGILETITKACHLWQKDCALIYAKDEKEAVTVAGEKSVCLAICDLTETNEKEVKKLARFTYTFPYIPCIALTGANSHLSTKILELGISGILENTFVPEELHRWLTELSELSTSGVLKGIEVHSLLQMLEGSGKTCTLEITTPQQQKGLVFINEGQVVTAETVDLKGEDAIYEIIGWDKLSIELRHYNGMRKREIRSSVMPLIMNALHLKEERTKLELRQVAKNKPRLNLKYFSTSQRSINLQFGNKIKIETDVKDASFVSTMVGIVPDKYLIISKPSGFDQLIDALGKDDDIVVNYLNMGKLCLFTTSLIKEIHEPENLLFVEFPKIIHYHELRKSKRERIFIPSTLITPEELDYHCVMTDLSTDGCMCEIRAARNAPLPVIDPGTKVKLQCLLPGLNSKKVIQCIAKNSKKSRSKVNLGLEFIETTEDVTESIQAYLHSLDNIIKGSVA